MEVEEPMDVDITGEFNKFDELLEEGEYVESNHITRKVPSVVALPEIPKIENKAAGTFVTGVDIFSKEAKEKMEERAKRFGIAKDAERSLFIEADRLYESFGIILGSENAKNYRLNVLHMRGTENMNTNDVFKYFEEYAPSSIEWINDISCNVVWLDQESAARAILGKSKKIVGLKKERNRRIHSDDDSEEDSDDTIVNGKYYGRDENVVRMKDIRCPLPPGIWRKGHDFMESKNIFLRFATRSDRKQLHAEKVGEYQKHGNPKHGELKGILTTSRKRVHKQIKEFSPTLKKEPNTNGIAAKNPWGSLSETWGVTDFVEEDYLPKIPIQPASNVKERLGSKPVEEDYEEEISNVIELSDESESESSSDEEKWCKRSKMPRMRMHADDEEEKIQKRKGKIRNILKSTTKIKGNDLRGRLTAKRRIPPPVYQRQPIQVVVTNPKVIRTSSFRNVVVTEDEDEDEDTQVVVEQEDDDDEEEEDGEIVDSGSDSKVEYEEEEDEEGVEEVASEPESDSSESSVSEKEVQGPKGSVIKVVQHKPKLQSTVSTVWSRLNHSKNDRNDDSSPDRHHSKRDLRHTLNKNDLRSRIGNHHMRGRSPLRIELRNDKYAGRQSDSE